MIWPVILWGSLSTRTSSTMNEFTYVPQTPSGKSYYRYAHTIYHKQCTCVLCFYYELEFAKKRGNFHI